MNLGRDGLPVPAPGVDVHRLAEAGPFYETPVVRPRVGHHDHRRRVEAFHEEPHLLVDGEAEGPASRLHAALPEPAFGCPQEGLGRLGVVLRFEEAEEAGALLVEAIVLAVDLGGDASDHLSVAVGQEELVVGVLEEGVRLGVKPLTLQIEQRRHPVRVVLIQAEGELHESIEVTPAGHRRHSHRHRRAPQGRRPCSRPRVWNCSRADSMCSSSWVAMQLVRRRALPMGTAGKMTGLV